MIAADQSLADWLNQLAARQPTPGGGGAAALAAAVGAAVGAMAAQYTTGKKWCDREAHSQQLIARLDQARADFLHCIDADAEAYAALQASWRNEQLSDAERAAIESRAAAVPAGLVVSCVEYVEALAEFLPLCNPNIRSDALVAIDLIAGAGRAAWRTRCCGALTDQDREQGANCLARLRAVESQLESYMP